MHISIVIPNYNGATLLRKNLPTVIAAVDYYKKTIGNPVEIIVTDDASTDNSLEILKDFKVKVITHEKNVGFGSNVNKGVKAANGDIVVLLNTDVIPDKDFLIPLLMHFVDKMVFAVGCIEKSIEGSRTVLRGRGVGHWQRGFLIHRRGEVDKDTTLWASGGSSAFRKKLWNKLGGFDSLYNPFYWEDIDLSYRALKSGYRVYFEKDSVVTHEHAKGVIKQSASAYRVKTIAYRNQFVFTWKNMTDVSLWFKHILWLPYHFLRALLRGDMAFFIGLFHAFFLIINVIKSSIEARKTFVKTDKQTLERLTA